MSKANSALNCYNASTSSDTVPICEVKLSCRCAFIYTDPGVSMPPYRDKIVPYQIVTLILLCRHKKQSCSNLCYYSNYLTETYQ